MLEIKYIRENAEAIQVAANNKNIDLDVATLLAIDKERIELLNEVETLKSVKNDLNDMMKSATDDERGEIIAKGKKIKAALEVKLPELRTVQEKYQHLMVKVPTIPATDVPVGVDESENVTVYEKGEKKTYDFDPLSHVDLAQSLDIIDFKRGAAVSGYRGYYLKNEGAELVMAMMTYAMHKMIAKDFMPMIPPTLVKDYALFGTGYFSGAQYNHATDEVFQVSSSMPADDFNTEHKGQKAKDKKFLVGTAEPSLLAYYADQVLAEGDLPIRICGYSPCYRSEIGSHGRDTTGLYRVHEFMKIEQVIIAPADVDLTEKLQEEMVAISEEILMELELPYRKLAICTGDMSAGKYRMFDLEVWMPGLERWGETGSASNFLDWQSRRLNARYKDAAGNVKHVYMLNNTVLPSVRPLIAILENFQRKDGSVEIPKVLRPFMHSNKKVITAKK